MLPAETQQALLERAGGNPLYAEQFARLYLERGSVDDLPLPEGVQGLIAARVDSLPAEEKALLQDAAVMGKVFWSGALAVDGDRFWSGCTLWNARSSSDASDARPSPARRSSPFATRSFATSRTGRSHAPTAPSKHVGAAGWIEGLGRPQDHAELLARHYLAALELDRAGEARHGEIRDRAVGCADGRGRSRGRVERFRAAADYYRSALAGPRRRGT